MIRWRSWAILWSIRLTSDLKWLIGRRGSRAPAAKAGQQHRDALAILLVAGTELRDEIAFLERDADEDVESGHGREQQMAEGHVWRCPEGEQEAQHDRVPHEPVEQWRLESLHAHRGSAQGGEYLAEAEQLEMINHVGRRQRRQPAEPIDRRQQGRGPTLHTPDRRDDRPPLPEDEEQKKARDQHIGAALAGCRNDRRPPALESRTRHDAMLDRE